MNVTIERKKPTECNSIKGGWHHTSRDDGLGGKNSSGLSSSSKVDVFYYGNPTNATKVDRKDQQLRQHMDKFDVSGYDLQNDKIIQNVQHLTLQRSSTSSSLKRKLPIKTTAPTATTSTTTTLCNPSNSMSPQLRHHLEFSRGIRTDVSLVPPIRQTASIFKQPVTVYKTQDSKVKNDLKHGTQDKPKQLFWEKRLEGLRACDITGSEFHSIDLPKSIKPVGPNVNEQTLLQSVATALHVSNQPVTGQTASKSALLTNSGVYLNPEQPLMHLVTITDDDIRRQEDRVNLARRRLQDALKG